MDILSGATAVGEECVRRCNGIVELSRKCGVLALLDGEEWGEVLGELGGENGLGELLSEELIRVKSRLLRIGRGEERLNPCGCRHRSPFPCVIPPRAVDLAERTRGNSVCVLLDNKFQLSTDSTISDPAIVVQLQTSDGIAAQRVCVLFQT